MRAICGAIITAGAMIGMGLTAIGFGTRYHSGLQDVDKDNNPILLHLSQMDKPLVFILVFMTATAIISTAWISFALKKETSDMAKSPEDRLEIMEMLDALGSALGNVIVKAGNHADMTK